MPVDATQDNPATELCTSCGICCTSLVFRRVGVTKQEADALESRVFHIFTSDRGNTYFHQPCMALKNNCCSIYDTRPLECRKWHCKLLRKLENGSVSLEQAKGRISRIRDLRIRDLKRDVVSDARLARGDETLAINLQIYMENRIDHFLKYQSTPGYRRNNIGAIKRIQSLLKEVQENIWRQPMLDKLSRISNVTMVRRSPSAQKPRNKV